MARRTSVRARDCVGGAVWGDGVQHRRSAAEGAAVLEKPADFEEFTAFISNGARWKMLGTLAVIGLTGALLIIFHPREADHRWLTLIAAKMLVLLIATVVFCYASWRLWPARIFASPEEIPKFQRRFRLVGYAMITMVVLAFVLAAVAHR